MSNWVSLVPAELVWEGPTGCSLDRMWTLVGKLHQNEKKRENNHIRSLWPTILNSNNNFLKDSINIGSKNNNISNEENRDNSVLLDEKLKSYLWTRIINLNDIYFVEDEFKIKEEISHKQKNKSSTKDDNNDDDNKIVDKNILLSLTYPQVIEKYPRILIVPNYNIYKQHVLRGAKLPQRFSDNTRNVLNIISNSRSDGITQAELCNIAKIENRSMYSTLKQLDALNLIERVPVVVKGVYTNIVIHKSLASKNEYFSSVSKHKHKKIENVNKAVKALRRSNSTKDVDFSDDSSVMSDNNIDNPLFQIKDEGNLTQIEVIKTKISNLLVSAKNNVIRNDDLYAIILLDKQGDAKKKRYLRNLISKMEEKGYVERVSVRGADNCLTRCVSLVKPYVINGDFKDTKLNLDSDTPEKPTNLSKSKTRLLISEPIEPQIYKFVHLSGKAGSSIQDVKEKLNIHAPKYLSKIFAKFEENHVYNVNNNNDTSNPKVNKRPGLISVVEFSGKIRYKRYFTEEAFNAKKTSSDLSNYYLQSYLDNLNSSTTTDTKTESNGSSSIIDVDNPSSSSVIVTLCDESNKSNSDNNVYTEVIPKGDKLKDKLKVKNKKDQPTDKSYRNIQEPEDKDKNSSQSIRKSRRAKKQISYEFENSSDMIEEGNKSEAAYAPSDSSSNTSFDSEEHVSDIDEPSKTSPSRKKFNFRLDEPIITTSNRTFGSDNIKKSLSITSIERRTMLFKIIQDLKVIELNRYLIKLYEDLSLSMGKSLKYKLDFKTVSNTIKNMESDNQIKLLKTSIKTLNGRNKLITLILHPSISSDDDSVKLFLKKYENVGLLSNIQNSIRAENIVNMDVDRIMPAELVKSNKQNISKGESSSNAAYYGFIAAKMVRVRIFHEWVVKYFTSKKNVDNILGESNLQKYYMNDGYFDMNDIGEAMSLSLFLKIIGYGDRTDAMDAVAKDKEMLIKPLYQQSNEIKLSISEYNKKTSATLKSIFDILVSLKLVKIVNNIVNLNIIKTFSSNTYQLLCQVPLCEYGAKGKYKVIKYLTLSDESKCQQYWMQFEFICLQKIRTRRRTEANIDTDTDPRISANNKQRPLGAVDTIDVEMMSDLSEDEDNINENPKYLNPSSGASELYLNGNLVATLNLHCNWYDISRINPEQRAFMDNYVNSRLKTTPIDNISLCQEIAKQCNLPLLSVRHYYKKLHYKWIIKSNSAQLNKDKSKNKTKTEKYSVRKSLFKDITGSIEREKISRQTVHDVIQKSKYRTILDESNLRGLDARISPNVARASDSIVMKENEKLPVINDVKEFHKNYLRTRASAFNWTPLQDETIVFAYVILRVSSLALNERFTPWNTIVDLVYGKDNVESWDHLVSLRIVFRRRYSNLSKKYPYYDLTKKLFTQYSKIQESSIKEGIIPPINHFNNPDWLPVHIEYMRNVLRRMALPGLVDSEADESGNKGIVSSITIPRHIEELHKVYRISVGEDLSPDYYLSLYDDITTKSAMSTLLKSSFSIGFTDPHDPNARKIFDYHVNKSIVGTDLLQSIAESLIKKILLTSSDKYNSQYAFTLLSTLPKDVINSATENLRSNGVIVGTKTLEYRRISGRGFQLSDKYLATLKGSMPSRLITQARTFYSNFEKKTDKLIHLSTSDHENHTQNSKIIEFSPLCNSGAMLVLIDLLSNEDIRINPEFKFNENIMIESISATPISLPNLSTSSLEISDIFANKYSALGRNKRVFNLLGLKNSKIATIKDLKSIDPHLILLLINEDVLSILPFQLDVHLLSAVNILTDSGDRFKAIDVNSDMEIEVDCIELGRNDNKSKAVKKRNLTVTEDIKVDLKEIDSKLINDLILPLIPYTPIGYKFIDLLDKCIIIMNNLSKDSKNKIKNQVYVGLKEDILKLDLSRLLEIKHVLLNNSKQLYKKVINSNHVHKLILNCKELEIVGIDEFIVIRSEFKGNWTISATSEELLKINKDIEINDARILNDTITNSSEVKSSMNPLKALDYINSSASTSTNSSIGNDDVSHESENTADLNINIRDVSIPTLAWYDLNNTYQDFIFRKFCDAVLMYIVEKPGISLVNIYKSMNIVISMVELKIVLEHLIAENKIKSKMVALKSRGYLGSYVSIKSKTLYDRNGMDYSKGIGSFLTDIAVGTYGEVSEVRITSSNGNENNLTYFQVENNGKTENVSSLGDIITCYWPSKRWYK